MALRVASGPLTREHVLVWEWRDGDFYVDSRFVLRCANCRREFWRMTFSGNPTLTETLADLRRAKSKALRDEECVCPVSA